jgi:hypothetical protein
MNIQYCQYCGSKISEEELAKGLGFDAGNNDFVCAACAAARGIPPQRGVASKRASGSRHPVPRGSGIRQAVNPKPPSGERPAINLRPPSGERPAIVTRTGSGARTTAIRHPKLDGVTPRRIGPLAFLVALLGIAIFGGTLYWKINHTTPAAPGENGAQSTDVSKASGAEQKSAETKTPTPAKTADPALKTAPVEPRYDPLSRGLVAHWKFDEAGGDVALDATGNHNDGKLIGGVTRIQGKIGSALQFDGTTGYVGIGRVLFKDLPTFAITFWVKPTATPGNRIGLAGQNDALEFGFDSGSIHIWTAGGGELLAPPWQFPNDEWHHIAVIGTSLRLKFFIDAKEVASLDQKTENYGGSGFNFNIGGGGIWDDKGNFFTGALDDVRLYAFSLDEAQIKALYELGAKK